MIPRVAVLVLALTSGLSGAQAQIIRDMSAERIREAIALGAKTKDLGWYRVQEKARWSWPPLIALYTTPFLRVALAANAAKRQYKTFTEADVTPEMLEPEILVYAPSHDVQGADIANVETVVLLPHDTKDPSKAVHPQRVAEASQAYKNLLGFSGEGRGLVAVFPLESWRDDYDVHVVFDKAIPGSHGANSVGGCMDCRSRIYLEKIR